MFSRILIANRGEIALRVNRTCRELDIDTIVVYSEADKNSITRELATEDICIGPAPSAQSYLDISRIIAAAEIADAEAVHPGYGFLSENAEFARIVEDAGMKFIGPPSDVIAKMGDKDAAKKLARAAGVPVVPGSDGLVANEEEALSVAAEIGYPVIIKATKGGGGRGMRVAHNAISLRSIFSQAKAEAGIAFHDDSVFIEKFIDKPRHVEIQFIADTHGNIVTLGERDCSVQRRHQKLIEESPCPVLLPEVRKRMEEATVALAKSSGYVNAGTAEYILDQDQNFYFLEVNARLQVEHPVTEMVTGVDLVREQILVATGRPLSFKQSDIQNRGHAIEVRINAEDPFNSFRPSPGEITRYFAPGGRGVRVDSHVYSGYRIPSNYDSMIAKLIVHAETRKLAIATMDRALSEYIIEGVSTTIPLYKDIFRHTLFVTGNVNTGFIDDFFQKPRVSSSSAQLKRVPMPKL
ncbi:MAG: acetyl-CoA carboxylase biotin carboxylase subunit [Planctomycetes bacterium]|nr:acetyl-CoA carboxylase biotin carboxylase subunit [Planctomycetota bacterium]